MAKKKESYEPLSSMPRTYSLLNEIRENKLYKAHWDRRDTRARAILEESCDSIQPMKLVKGNIYVFKYFEPKTRAELEYYDAYPAIILFGEFNAKEGGRRYLGFNVHYYPPRIRFEVLNKVMEIYQNIYKKSWEDGLKRDLSHLEYAQLLYLLKKSKLDFGVRMYIPALIKEAVVVPPNLWHIAAFTEGMFKKRTREMIMKYWRSWRS